MHPPTTKRGCRRVCQPTQPRPLQEPVHSHLLRCPNLPAILLRAPSTELGDRVDVVEQHEIRLIGQCGQRSAVLIAHHRLHRKTTSAGRRV